MNIEKYIAVKNNKIISEYETTQGYAGIINGLRNENITDYDKILLVPFSNESYINKDVREFNNKWELRSLWSRVKEGLTPLPIDKKIENRRIKDKTLKELIQDQVIVLNHDEIYDEQQNIIRKKTEQEQYPIEILEQMRKEITKKINKTKKEKEKNS